MSTIVPESTLFEGPQRYSETYDRPQFTDKKRFEVVEGGLATRRLWTDVPLRSKRNVRPHYLYPVGDMMDKGEKYQKGEIRSLESYLQWRSLLGRGRWNLILQEY